MRRKTKYVTAANIEELLNMNTSVKEVDKAVKSLNDASMTLKKFQAALDARGIKKKIDEATKKDIASLVGRIDKIIVETQNYVIKLASVRETLK